MNQIRFGVCEYNFPCWGASAMRMASAAGFDGMQIADAGGYLQPHPGNNGYVEYERYGLDLRRKDSFPLSFPEVQAYYLEAAAPYGIQLTSIYLYTLEHQGFIKFSKDTPQGEQCRESLRRGILAASQMGIPSVTVAAKGMFGVAQNDYAFSALQYAAEIAREHGIQLVVTTDLAPELQLRLVDALGVQLSLDTFAPLVYGNGEPVSLLQEAGLERIGHIRVRDSRLDQEGFPSFETGISLLGAGRTSFQKTVQAIKDLGYQGWIISDTPYYHPALQAQGEDYISVAQKDVQTLRTAFFDNH